MTQLKAFVIEEGYDDILSLLKAGFTVKLNLPYLYATRYQKNLYTVYYVYNEYVMMHNDHNHTFDTTKNIL